MDLKFTEEVEKTIDIGGAIVTYVEALPVDRSAAYAASVTPDAGGQVFDPSAFSRVLFSRCVRAWDGVNLNGAPLTTDSALRVRGRVYRGAEIFVFFDELAGPLMTAILPRVEEPPVNP